MSLGQWKTQKLFLHKRLLPCIVGEEVLAPTKLDPCLDLTGTIGVKPDTDVLHVQLLVIGQVTERQSHGTE